MAEPTTPKKLIELIDAACEGLLSAAQAAELEEHLRADAEAARLFARQCELHVELWFTVRGERAMAQIGQEVVRTNAFAEAAEQPAEVAVTRREPKGIVRLAEKTTSFITRPTPFSVAVAAVVIGLLITAMAFIAAPMYRSLAVTRQPADKGLPTIAQLTNSQDAIWADGQVGTVIGSRLLEGHQLSLRNGRAEVTFNNGVVLTLQGPAQLSIDALGAASLRQGKILAHVPPAGVGFKVFTPSFDVVDLGTEFGVLVQPGISSEVHVVQGHVEVSSAAGLSAEGRILLGPGQAWKFEKGSSKGKMLASNPARFRLAIAKTSMAVFQAGRPDPITGDEYQGAEDVMLIAWGPNNNFGQRADFDVGHLQGEQANALLRFDLTSLQGQFDRIVAVTLRITPNSEVFYFPWSGDGKIELYRVCAANAHWLEGAHVSSQQGVSNADAGDSTWNHLGYPDRRWAGSSGANKPAADHESVPLASALYSSRTRGSLDFRFYGDLQFIQDWIDGKPNGGFLLKETTRGEDNRINFHSSQSKSISARPQLIVHYFPRVDETVDDNTQQAEFAGDSEKSPAEQQD